MNRNFLIYKNSSTKWIDLKLPNQAERFNKSPIKIIYPSSENIYFKLPQKLFDDKYQPFPKNPIFINKLDSTIKVGPSKDRPKRLFV